MKIASLTLMSLLINAKHHENTMHRFVIGHEANPNETMTDFDVSRSTIHLW